MPNSIHLVFDGLPDQVEAAHDRVVWCADEGQENPAFGVTRREFCGTGYEAVGREVCLWWYRQFSTANADGVCLHDVFNWDGTSALWHTSIPFLYPYEGVFPRLMLAVELLRRADSGEVQEIRLTGAEPELVQTLRAASLPVEVNSDSGTRRSEVGSQGRFSRAWKALERWFLRPRHLRYRHSYTHAPSQWETLLYSAAPTEWIDSEKGGRHRYLQDAVDEMVQGGWVKEARPILAGAPPVSSSADEWDAFVDYSLRSKHAIHPLGFLDPAVVPKARRWVRSQLSRFEEWLATAPPGWGTWQGHDLRPFILPRVRSSQRLLLPSILQYESLFRTFKIVRPKGFLLKDEVYPGARVMVAAARRAQIPTVSIQHGSIYPTHWCYVMDPDAQGIARPPLPHRIGVYGEATARLLTEWGGFPANLIRVVGARRFRLVQTVDVDEQMRAFASRHRALFLFAGQVHPEMDTIYEWMYSMPKEFPQAGFVFKPHPREMYRLEQIESAIAGQDNVRVFTGPLGAVLPLASVTLSGHSTVLLESVWCGIPAVSMQISGETEAAWQRDAGILKVVRTREGLWDALDQSIEGTLVDESDRERAKVYLEQHLGFSRCADPEALAALFRPGP